MSRAARRAALPVAVLLAAGAVASAAATPGPPPAVPVAPATAAAALPGAPLRLVRPLEQDRLDATRQRLEVPLVNPGTAPVTVVGLQLQSARLTAVPPADDVITLAPGEELDLVLPYGDAVCATTGAGAVATDRLVVDTRAGTGPVAHGQLPLAGDDALLVRLQEALCRQRAVDADLALELTPDGPPVLAAGVPTLPVTLHVRRRAGDPAVEVSEVDGSVAYALAPTTTAPPPLLRLAPGTAGAAAPLRFSALRCDPHGLVEVKKVFVFLVYVGLDGAPPAPVELAAPPALQAQLEATRALCPPTAFDGG